MGLFFFFFVLNHFFFVIFFSREHEKEVQNRKRGKRPRGRPRKHVVSPGGAGNPQQRQPWRGSDPEGHQRVSVPQHGVMGAEPTEGGKDTAVPADPVVEALQSACSLTHFMAEAACHLGREAQEHRERTCVLVQGTQPDHAGGFAVSLAVL